ncbi:glycoprotein 3-alpha-L-fucosyltransferase A-like isoform X2 [Ornithodoros turicata]|uniref:glycoprotein 3-alpha-L-fucosyltransferase A-like isoform X2 n=1 Tax=Ornithodoros turicata TaxID=34597 RepID=UPI00313958AB
MIYRRLQRSCCHFCDRRVLCRTFIFGFLSLTFVVLICIHFNLNDQPIHLHNVESWNQELSYEDRVRRIMERQIFRNNSALDHEHDSAWKSQALKLPWFMRSGVIRPSPSSTVSRSQRIWPSNSSGDRIVNQLMYLPPYYTTHQTGNGTRLKTIVLHGSWDDFAEGRHLFVRDKCPVDTCRVYRSGLLNETVDAIVFKDYIHASSDRTDPRQIWILYMLENPYHSPVVGGEGCINWTATYRRDSEIVTPYEKFVLFDPFVKKLPLNGRNFAQNKSKSVAWFVSNCRADNSRLEYAQELRKYIQVDIYGRCGPLKCPRNQSEQCLQMLSEHYKFYLAFENTNCRDYITEKFYNALRHNVLPIVMGASRTDYQKVAPFHSYIHVDDFATPKDLAEYLKHLDRNTNLYNEYFAWKGTGEFINTYFWCRLCAMLHSPPRPPHGHHVYEDVSSWWHKDACVGNRHKRLWMFAPL